MSHANHLLLLIAALIAVSGGSAFLLNWSFRRQGGLVKGWGGALFILLCWSAALLLIVYRSAG